MEKEVCLIFDAKNEYEDVFLNAKNALMGGADKILLHNPRSYNQNELARFIELCHNYEATLLFINDLEYAEINDADGIHFDAMPIEPIAVERDKAFIVGVEVDATTEFSGDFDYIVINNSEGGNANGFFEGSKALNTSIYLKIDFSTNLSQITLDNAVGVMLKFEKTKIKDITNDIQNIKSNINA